MLRLLFDLLVQGVAGTGSYLPRRRGRGPIPGTRALSRTDAARRLGAWVRWGRDASLDVDLRAQRFSGSLHGVEVDVRVGAVGDLALPSVVVARIPADTDLDITREAMAVEPSPEEDGRAWLRELFRACPGLQSLGLRDGSARLGLAWDARPDEVDACIRALAERERTRVQTYRG
jgi:hypothetical protein